MGWCCLRRKERWKDDCKRSRGVLSKKGKKRAGFRAKHTAACYDRRNTNIMTTPRSELERHFRANGTEKINLWFQSICWAAASWLARTKQRRWEGVNVITWSATERWQIFGERDPMCFTVGPVSGRLLWKQHSSWMEKEKRIHSGTCTHTCKRTHTHTLPLSSREFLRGSFVHVGP